VSGPDGGKAYCRIVGKRSDFPWTYAHLHRREGRHCLFYANWPETRVSVSVYVAGCVHFFGLFKFLSV
jgi:hypothetical protein